MSGIAIDVDNNAPSATRDMNALNKAMMENIRLSTQSAAKVKAFDSTAFLNMQKQVLNLQTQMVSLGRTSGTANNDMQRGAANTGTAMEGLARKVQLVTGAFLALKGANALHGMSDQLVNVNNRLNLVSKSSDEVIRRQTKIYEIAKDTRTEMAGTADLVVNFTRSLEKVGIAETKVNRIVTTIQKSATLSGSSVDAIRGALIQLNQGIGSGTLRGEELNSVLEQMAYLGQGLTRVLGMNTGQLRKFAEEGRLTTSVLIGAIEKLGEQADADFAKTAVTSEQARKRLGGALRYMAADVDNFFGITAGFSRRLINLADSVDSFNSTLITRLVNIRQTITNYIKEFDRMSAIDLTIKTATKFELTPMQLYDRYQLYRNVKKRIDSVRRWFSTEEEDTNLTMSFVLNSLGIERQVDNTKRSTAAFRELKNVVAELGNTLVVTGRGMWANAPKLAEPVVKYVDRIRGSLDANRFAIDQNVFKKMMPWARELEGVSEALTFSTFSDTKMERSVTKLFQTRSIVAFRKQLEEVNEVRKDATRADAWDFQARELYRNFREGVKPITDFGIAIGLLNNRVLHLRLGDSFDRIAHSMETWRRVAVRVYNDVLYPNFAPYVQRLGIAISQYAQAAASGLDKAFTFKNGRIAGAHFAYGILDALGWVRKQIRGLFTIVVDQTQAETMGMKVAQSFYRGLQNLFKWAKGFGTGFLEAMFDTKRVYSATDLLIAALAGQGRPLDMFYADLGDMASKTADAINSIKLPGGGVFKDLTEGAADWFNGMYKKIDNVTNEGLSRVMGKIKNFATAVKREFFLIYDDVVGHSTWPDLIDGIVKYTDNINPAQTKLERFGNGIRNLFERLANTVSAGPIGDAFRNIEQKLADIDWSKGVDRLRENLGAVLLAAITFAFGGWQAKLATAHVIYTFVNTAFGGAISSIMPGLGEWTGKALGQFGAMIRESLLHTISNVMGAIVPFLQGFLGEFSVVFEWIVKALTFGPDVLKSIFNLDQVASAVIGFLAAYSLIWRGGFEKVKGLLFSSGKEAGKAGQMGFFDALMMVTNMPGGGMGGFFSKLFVEKKIAILAGLTFATSFIEGIDLIDAAAVGAPLLITSILGKQGTQRIISGFWSGIRDQFQTEFSNLNRMVQKNVGGSIFAKAFGAANSVVGADIKGSARKQAAGFGKELSASITSFMASREAFGRGDISFDDMFTSKLPKGTVGIKKYMSDWWGDLMIFGARATDITRTAQTKTAQGFINLRQAWAEGQAAVTRQAVKSNYGQMLIDMWPSIVEAARRALTTMAGLLVKYRVLLIGVLTLVTVNSANAGTGIAQVFDSLSGSLTTLASVAGTVVVLAGAMKLLGNVSREVRGKVADAFTPDLEAAATERSMSLHRERMAAMNKEMAAARRANRYYPQVMALRAHNNVMSAPNADPDSPETKKRAREAARATYREYFSEFNAGQRRQRAKASTASLAEAAQYVEGYRVAAQKSVSISGAVIDSLKARLFSAIDGTRSFMGSFASFIGTVFVNPAQAATQAGQALARAFTVDKAADGARRASESALAAVSSLSAGFAAMRAGSYAAGLANIAGSIGQLTVAAIAGAKSLLLLAASSVTNPLKAMSALLAGMTSILRGLATAALFAVGSITKLIAAISTMLGIPLLLIGGIAAVGTIALALFGPGDSITERLEWIYDKVRSIFGLQPSTTAGKRMTLQDEFKPVTIGGSTADFTQELSWVDFEKLTTEQTTVLRELAANNKEAFKRLEAEFIKNGRLDSEQLAEFARLNRETSGILSRQPAVADKSLAGVYARGAGDLVQSDQSTSTRLNRLFGYTSRETGPSVAGFNWVGEMLEDMTDAVKLRLTILKFDIMDFVTGLLPVQIAMAGFNAVMTVGAEAINFITDAYTRLTVMMRRVMDAMIIGGAIFGVLLAPVLGVTAGIGLLVGAVTGLVAGGYLVKFAEWLGEVGKTIKKRMDGEPTPEQLARQSGYRKANEKVLKYQDFLPPEVRELMSRTDREATSARAMADRLRSRGYRKSQDGSQEGYGTRYVEAERLAMQKEAFNLQLKEVYGDFAEDSFFVKKFADAMDDLGKSTKAYLELDFGALGDKVRGTTATNEELAKLVEESKVLTFKLSRSRSAEQARFLQMQKSQVEARAKSIQTMSMADTNMQVSLNLQVDNLSVDKEKLQGALMLNPELFQQFQELSKEAQKVKTEIDNLGTYSDDPEAFVKLRKELTRIQTEASKLVKTPLSFDGISKGLSEMGVQGFDMSKMTFTSENALKGLMSNIDSYREKVNNLNTLSLSGAPFSAQIAALREIVKLTNQTNAALKTATSTAVKDILAGDGSDLTKAIRVEAATGVEIPVEVFKKGLAGKYNQVQSRKLEADALVAEGSVDPNGLSDAQAKFVAKARIDSSKFAEQMSKMAENRKVSIDAVINALSGAGVDIDMSRFGFLSSSLQKQFAALGSEYEALTHRLSEVGPGAAGSAALTKMLERQRAIVEKAVKMASLITLTTGEQLNQRLEDAGVTAVRSLTVSSVQQILKASKAIDLLKASNKRTFDTSNASEVAKFLANMKEQNRLTMELRQNTEKLGRTFDQKLSDVNEIFGVRLEQIDFSRMGKNAQDMLAAVSLDLKHRLENALETGSAALPSILEEIDLAKLKGQFLQLITDFRKDMRDGMLEGAKAGYERVKSLMGDSPFEMGQFTELNGSTRRGLGADASLINALEKAMEMPGLTQAGADVFEGFTVGEPLSDMMAKLTALYGDMSQVTNTPLERNNTLLERLNTNLEKGLTGAGLPGVPGTTAVAGTGIMGGSPGSVAASVSGGAYRGLNEAKATYRSQVLNEIIGDRFGADRLRTMMPGITARGALATSDKTRAYAESVFMLRQEKQGLASNATGEEKVRLDASVEALNAVLEKMVDGINHAAERGKEAGAQFSANMGQIASGAFSGLLKGETDGNSGIFGTFAKRIADGFFTNVTDTITNGLMNGLLGGPMDKVFSDLGTSLFDGFSGLFSGMDFSGLLSGLDLGSMFSGLMSVFGFAEGGHVTGPGTGTSDSIPARLSNGEFVVKAKATRKHLPLLKAINSGYVPTFADGGLVSASPLQMPSSISYEQLQANQTTGGNTQIINLEITGDISRQTRSEVYKMLPQIAAGVNSTNKEQNYQG